MDPFNRPGRKVSLGRQGILRHSKWSSPKTDNLGPFPCLREAVGNLPIMRLFGHYGIALPDCHHPRRNVDRQILPRSNCSQEDEEMSTSPWIENRIVIGIADEDTLKEHGR